MFGHLCTGKGRSLRATVSTESVGKSRDLGICIWDDQESSPVAANFRKAQSIMYAGSARMAILNDGITTQGPELRCLLETSVHAFVPVSCLH